MADFKAGRINATFLVPCCLIAEPLYHRMSNSSVLASLKKISAAYKAILQRIPEGQFQTTPPIGGWSYSEVYSHIFDASILSLGEVENCIRGEGKTRSTALVVKVILFLGSFPPAARYKAPKMLQGREKKTDRATAAAFIEKFTTLLDNTYPGITQASPALKTRHPRLGYLNAEQWFRFTEIHLKHHLKQLKRIEKSF